MAYLRGPIALGLEKQISPFLFLQILAKTTFIVFSTILLSMYLMEINLVGRGSLENIERNQENQNNFYFILVILLLTVVVIILVNPVSNIFKFDLPSLIFRNEGLIFSIILFTQLVLFPISMIFSITNSEYTILMLGSILLRQTSDAESLPWQRTQSPVLQILPKVQEESSETERIERSLSFSNIFLQYLMSLKQEITLQN